MTAKTYLRQVKWLEIKIEQKKFQLKGLNDNIDYLHAIDYSLDKVQTSPRDSMAEMVIRVHQLREQLLGEIAAFERTRDEIIRQIQSTSKPSFAELLFKRYVEHKDFYIIAKDMGYVYESIINMHGSALKAFAEQFLDAQELAGAPETSRGYSA